jgi:hypothetical protein
MFCHLQWAILAIRLFNTGLPSLIQKYVVSLNTRVLSDAAAAAYHNRRHTSTGTSAAGEGTGHPRQKHGRTENGRGAAMHAMPT